MAKTIVTHLNPDLDAITAVWLLVRFGGNEFSKARLAFVPAGERLEGEDQNTVHVDTGLGKFDHHQEDRGKTDTSAAMLVYEWLVAEGRIKEQEALRRLANEVKDFDHFREYFWPEPTADRYEFFLGHVLNGMKLGKHVGSDDELVEFGMRCLDGTLIGFKIRVAAEKEFEKGVSFTSRWGKALAVESASSGVMKLGLKNGYSVVIRRDPESGMIRIKSAPLLEINLGGVYERLMERDPQATWYFHPSGHMVLNGSIRNPKMRPSKLSLEDVIDLVKSVQ